VSASHAAGPAPDRLRGPLTGVPAEVKVVGLVAFMVIVAVTPPSRPWALAAQAAVAVAVAALAFVDWRAVVGRLALDLPLVVLAVAYALAGRGPDVDVAGVALSEPGLRAGLGVLAKATIGIVVVSALAASTSVPDTIAGLARLGVPRWFRELLAHAVRQLQVLRADLARIRRVVEVRTAATRRTVALAAGARSLGSLFVRSTERADTLHLAAELRGGPKTELGRETDSMSPQSSPVRVVGVRWAAGLAPAALAAVAVVVLA
jgi:cobalt/nickel transport system permease protein